MKIEIMQMNAVYVMRARALLRQNCIKSLVLLLDFSVGCVPYKLQIVVFDYEKLKIDLSGKFNTRMH